MHNDNDLLNKAFLSEADMRQLNFISKLPANHTRRHFRQGLRSHIFEILSAADVYKELNGEVVNGVRMFPRAVPQYMFRIMRTPFATLNEALDEVTKYKLLLRFLGPECIARSDEFIVEYRVSGKKTIVLCGLQEYVTGAILDPWSLFKQIPFDVFFRSKFPKEKLYKNCVKTAIDSIAAFVRKVRKMVFESGYIPDLAGNGNLVLTPQGAIRLVDINNIIRIEKKDTIFLDDKQYPSCDKSVEVLAIFEQEILKTKNLLDDPLYGHYLTVERKEKVSRLEEKFNQSFVR